ncbi:hypothetical protein BDQ17DRAFT_1340671 [Cyathus striatus]|nr:hypothetical protein BDQ17DRAFT_1340671 [Cyathus striatus]
MRVLKTRLTDINDFLRLFSFFAYWIVVTYILLIVISFADFGYLKYKYVIDYINLIKTFIAVLFFRRLRLPRQDANSAQKRLCQA